ncbi:MFS transporter [Thalassotalea insulae]|uniref:MFS transporter n=1 Tax=Thalassotalea insulae TaxID=2056778 RepID=A0ABQ6GNL5_9GAMM|nr:MFS transporter [Thalassotalea insulae]GLX77532.1 MFS transporter [Thalassotalea insulae]
MSSPLFQKLSISYFCYFSLLGLVTPFLPVFLDGRGFNSLQIGEILAMFTATKIIGPTLWAMVADKSGKQLSIIQLGSTLALLFFTLLFWVDGYWPITFVLAIFSLFWTAILPQFEVMTMLSIRRNAKIYARIRLWGSVGFIVLAVLAGEVIGRFSSEAFTYLGWLMLLMLAGSSYLLKQPRERKLRVGEASSILSKILAVNFVIFFIAGLLLQISFGPYYSFFALYLRDLAYPDYAVGLLISLGVIAEIAVFFIAGNLYSLFGARLLIVFSLLITALRWYLTGYFADNLTLLLIAQLIHAASFGLYHSASIQFLQQHFQVNQQNRGQAIYVAGVYGIGGALGAYCSGVVWQDGSGAQMAFEYAAIACFIAGCFACFIKPPIAK